VNRTPVRSIGAVFAGAIVAFGAAPFAASAQSTDLTVDRVRSEFVADGYQVSAPLNWWTNNHVATFTVSDASGQNDRIVMVLVYPDTATAQTETAGSDQLAGPRLVPGYGPALVRQNVALVESTQQALSQRYTSEQASQEVADFGATAVMPAAPAPVTRAVESEFISALDASFAAL